jgi:hypothetical protein
MTILNLVRKELLDNGVTEGTLNFAKPTLRAETILNRVFRNLMFKFGALSDSKLK